MPDEDATPDHGDNGSGVTVYGIASTALGVIAVVAVALGALVWSAHRGDMAEQEYQTRVLQAAAEWTDVLVNLDTDTVQAGMQTLQEGTVGQLNTDFESTVEPFRELVQTLQSSTTGQVDSVAIESIHHTLPGPDGTPSPQPPPELSATASRTDTVMVEATSVSENTGGQAPQTVRWNLRLGISDVNGELLISRLEPIR